MSPAPLTAGSAELRPGSGGGGAAGPRPGPARRPAGGRGAAGGGRRPGWPGRSRARGQVGDLRRDPPLVVLRRVGARAGTAGGTAAPGPDGARPASARNHSRAPGRRCSTIGLTLAAPAAAICRTVSASCPGESVRNGSTGPIRTPQRRPLAGDRGAGLEPPLRARGAGLDRGGKLGVGEADRQVQGDRGDLRCLFEQIEVAQQQRALGQDGERVAGVAQRADDAGHQPVPPSARW